MPQQAVTTHSSMPAMHAAQNEGRTKVMPISLASAAAHSSMTAAATRPQCCSPV